MTHTPLLVALVGIPTSGKTEAQNQLSRRNNIRPIDDFATVRRFCGDFFGFTEEEMVSQKGKAEIVTVNGVTAPRRWFLGEMGSIIEQKFGPLAVPNDAIRKTLQLDEQTDPRFRPSGYSFGSVRRLQPRAYAAIPGSLIIEIVRPGVEPTGNVWDEYERDDITHTVLNDDTPEVLGARISEIVSEALYNHTLRRYA